MSLSYAVGPHAIGCNPAAGSIDVEVAGGTPPYAYTWSSGQVTQDIQNEIPSFYWVRATDANGCAVISDWIQIPWARNIIVTGQVTPTCFFGDLGAVDIDVTGGTPPYTYDWWDVHGFTSTNEDISGLADGNYFLDIIDANGCRAQYFFTVVIDWSALQLTAQVTNSPSCGLGGAIDLTVTGGSGPYQYYWGYGGGITTEDLSGIPAGSYNIQVTDQNGCMAFANYVVEGTPKSVHLTADVTGTCNGLALGAVDITMTGGVPPFQFTWGGPGGFSATTEDVGALAPGNYWVFVQDAIGCTASEAVEVPLVDPFTLSADLFPTCNATGSIDLTVTGGVGPFTYAWLPTGQTTEDISNVPNNFYVVTVTDAAGCQVTANWYLGTLPINLNTTTTMPACYGEQNGSIDLVVNFGAPPFIYAWSSGDSTEDISGLASGLYSVTVTDADGCSASGQFNIGQNSQLFLNPVGVLPSCPNEGTGSINNAFGGGTAPYTFNWSGPDGFSTITKIPAITSVLPGIYTLVMTDELGCTLTQTYTVAGYPAVVIEAFVVPSCSANASGVIELEIEGGTAPLAFYWNGPDGFTATTEDIASLAPGTYQLFVSDANNCNTYVSWVIESSPCCEADRFYPHGTLSSTVTNPASGTIDIQGQFIIDQDFTFDNATVYMEPGAEIIQLDGTNLWVNNSTIQSCQDVMWKGITTGNGCIAQLKSSMIADAESGIRAMNSSIVLVDGSEFKNNRIGIEVPDQGGLNSVVVYPWNSTFHAEGPLALPYPGQTTIVGQNGYAALVVSDMSLDFTGTGNSIRNLNNGIVGQRSNITVQNCTFKDIQPDGGLGTVSNGSAIYADGGTSFVTLKQVGFGTTTGAAPSFQNCRWGIYTEYMNVYSLLNNMVNVGTAYHVERSGYRNIDIFNNKLDTRFDGIQLYMNDGCVHMDIAINDITFATNPPPGQFVKGYSAIVVKEANAANLNSVIQNNTIHYRANATTAYAGIRLTSANDFKVLNNTLEMDNNANNYAGIYTSGCTRPLISCNTVTGSNTNYNVNDGQSAIRNNMGDGVSIVCNDVDATTNGILFSGATLNTDLSGNNIRRHKWGLHAGGATVLQDQDRKGNLWYNTPEPNGLHAWSENLNAGDYPCNYFPEMIMGGNAEPVQQLPVNWFLPVNGPNYRCDDGETNYCAQYEKLVCEACKTELDAKVANDDLENNPYTEETKQILENDLYKKLDNAPIMLANDQELADFYAAMQNTNVAQFKLINDDYLALYDLDASITAYLAANKTQIEGLMDQLKLAMQQLADETLTPAQRQTIMANANGLQLSVRNLTTLNDQALQLAATSKALNADNVKAANNSVGTTELIETNEKQVKEIYLNTVAKEVDSFTSTEAAALLAIANQCPMVGGNAVYRARSLYALIDDDMEYNDASLCLQHGIIYKSRKPKTITEVSIQPNPTNDAATLLYPFYEDMQGTLIIYDALGKEVQRHRLSQDVVRYEFSTAELKQGAYHYAVSNGADVIGTGKLMIVR